MSGIEYADAQRLPGRNRPFPDRWGGIPADVGQRAVWIAANLRTDRTAAGLDTEVRALRPGVELTARRSRPLDARHALLALRARELPPR